MVLFQSARMNWRRILLPSIIGCGFAVAAPAVVAGSEAGKEIRITLSGPKNPVQSDDEINLNLAIENISSGTIRIFNPRCNLQYDQSHLGLVIVKEPGQRVMRIGGTHLTDFGPLPRMGSTTELKPQKRANFRCQLVKKPAEQHALWRFTYPDDGPHAWQTPSWPRLAPGQYRIRAHYWLVGSEVEQQNLWNADFANKFGPLWLGEIDSNEIVVKIIKNKH
jgi:hypothetical protein